jgi:hypothetical protein
MTDTNENDRPKSKGHRFQKGHKFGGGRPKNALNKKTLKQKALEALTGAGVKLAQKAGLNKNVDGFTHYIEDLAGKNPSAAATLVTKLISMEEAAPAASSGHTMPIIVNAVLSGNQFSPGGPDDRILLPFDLCTEAWAAYHSGQETWKTYLDEIEGQLTAKSFARLSRVVAPDREKLLTDAPPLLRLVHDEPAQAPEASQSKLLTELERLSDEQLRERAIACGLDPSLLSSSPNTSNNPSKS